MLRLPWDLWSMADFRTLRTMTHVKTLGPQVTGIKQEKEREKERETERKCNKENERERDDRERKEFGKTKWSTGRKTQRRQIKQ